MSYTSDMTDCGLFCSWCFRWWRVLQFTFPLYVVVNDWYVLQLTPLTCVFCNRRQSRRLHIWCFWLRCVSEPAFLDREDIHQAGMLPLHPQHARPYEVTHARTHCTFWHHVIMVRRSDRQPSSNFCYLPFCSIFSFFLYDVQSKCSALKIWLMKADATVFGLNRSCLVQFSVEFFFPFFVIKVGKTIAAARKMTGSAAMSFFNIQEVTRNDFRLKYSLCKYL